MKKSLLFVLSVFIGLLSALAQQSEFGTAANINATESKTGSVGKDNRNVYYKTLLPADGTVIVYIEAVHTGGPKNSFAFYAYDKSRRQVFGETQLGNKTVNQGETIKDTLRIYSREADSLYLLLYHNSNSSFNFFIKYEVAEQSPNDKESNDNFSLALNIEQNAIAKGHIGYVANGGTDRNDYYKTMLKKSGKVRIFLEAIHTGGSNGSFALYAYDKRKRQILGKTVVGDKSAKLGELIRDTIDIHSREADSLYFLIYENSNRSFAYSLKYDIVDQSVVDREPNNERPEASPIEMGETVEGQLGYVANSVTDRNDYYKTLLPADGTITVYIEGTHTGGSTGSFAFYAYDKRGRQISSKTVLGNSNANAGDVIKDTIEIYSRAADTVYLMLYQNSNRSYTYRLSYQVTNQSANDVEPNDVFAEAIGIEEHDVMQGHLGYEANNVTDRNDYYKTLLPADGTITVYIEGTHTGGTNGSFAFYAYDKGGRQISSKTVLGNSNAKAGDIIKDTIEIYSRAADTVYLMLYQNSNRSYSYRLSYEVTNQSANDIEPNGEFPEAIVIGEHETLQGHLGYEANNVTDRNDHYKTMQPLDGTVKVIIEGIHTGGSKGSFAFYAYDKGKRQISSKTVLGEAVEMGEKIRDTIFIKSRAADSIYFLMYQNSNRSFSYKFSYSVIDTSVNDVEPNAEFVDAIEIKERQTMNGHIGYEANNVTDRYDYYKTLLPVDGTVTVYIEGVHTGGSAGSLAFYAYDKRRRQIESKTVLGNSKASEGHRIYDTIRIDSRAADSLYFLIYQNSSRSYSYKIRYEMPVTYTGDPEPNNTYNEAVNFKLRDTLEGLIGYVQAGASDRYDYYKAALPGGSTVKLFVEGEHTGGSNGSFAFYAYDNRKRQIASKTILGNAAISQGSTFKDTVTINCVNSDSIYVVFYQSSSRSFTYSARVTLEDNQPEAVVGHNIAGGLHEFTNLSKNAMSYSWNLGDSTMSDKEAPELKSYKAGSYEVRLIAKNAKCNFTDTARYRFTVNGLDRYTPVSGGPGNIEFTAYGGGFHEGMHVRLKQGSRIFQDSASWVNEHGNIFAAVIDMHSALQGVYDVEVITRDTTYLFKGGFVSEALVDKLKTEIIGRDIIRINTNTPYAVRIHNEGNTMAGLVEVYILFPSYMKVTVLDSLANLVRSQFPDLNLDTVPLFKKVTKERGYPIDGNLYEFYLAGIPAGGFRDLSFMVNSGVGREKIYTWVKGPMSGSEYKGWFDPCNKAKMKMVIDAIADGISAIPIADCAVSVVKGIGSTLYSAYSWITGGGDPPTASLTKTALGVAKNCAGEALIAAGFAPGIAVEIADVLSDLAIMGSNAHVNAKLVADACADEPTEPEEKPVDVRTSMDPNAKSGPSGFGDQRFINGLNKTMNYTIFFENMAIATLPAQRVIILDTLDKNVFNLETFRAFTFSIGSERYKLPVGASDYSMDVDLNNVLSVRIVVNLDKQTGIMKAVFKTLDKKTGSVTEDPLAGFLPPNTNAPDGEGSLSFGIDLKDGLPDGTVIRNRASIVFDENDAIITEDWVNTLDRNTPNSEVSEVYQFDDSTVVVKTTGSDPASGVRNYRLYVSEDGADYKFVGIMRDTVKFEGKKNSTYEFYAVAVDMVGNREVKAPTSEANIQLRSETEEPQVAGELVAYPIPTSGTLTVHLDVPNEQQINISVFSPAGQRVATIFEGSAQGVLKLTKNLNHLSSGIYFIKARGSRGLSMYKKIMIVR